MFNQVTSDFCVSILLHLPQRLLYIATLCVFFSGKDFSTILSSLFSSHKIIIIWMTFYLHSYIILVLSMLMVNTGRFIYSFLIFKYVISFSCFITLSKTLGVVLERRDEHLQLHCQLKGKEFSIFTANVMLAEGL